MFGAAGWGLGRFARRKRDAQLHLHMLGMPNQKLLVANRFLAHVSREFWLREPGGKTKRYYGSVSKHRMHHSVKFQGGLLKVLSRDLAFLDLGIQRDQSVLREPVNLRAANTFRRKAANRFCEQN